MITLDDEPVGSTVDLLRVTGFVDAYYFKSDETGYAIVKLKVENPTEEIRKYLRAKNCLAVKGVLGGLSIGDTIEVVGRKESHPAYGYSLVCDHYTIKDSTTRSGVIAYLQGTMKHIGPVIATRIVNHFGLDTLRVLDEEPKRLYEVDGVGKTRVGQIIKRWPETRALRNLCVFLSTIGVPTSCADKFLKAFGTKAVDRIKEDPYALSRYVDGFGFKKADAIAIKLGVPLVSSFRIRAACEHVLRECASQNGDCFVYQQDLTTRCMELLAEPSITPAIVEDVLRQSHKAELLVCVDTRVYLRHFYTAEQVAAANLASILKKPITFDAQECFCVAVQSASVELDPTQIEAIRNSLFSKVSIITGGPGTGKTEITRSLVAGYLHAGYSPGDAAGGLCLLAPTGRAAKRMSEVIGQPAYTIHRLLHARESSLAPPMKDVVVIVDEMSMTDLVTFSRLLSHCGDSVVLVLIGDIDQLPSVGAGSVLRDCLDCEHIPSTRLTTIHRQAAGSDIVTNAHRVNKGQVPALIRFGHGLGWPKTDMYAYTHENPDHLADMAVWCGTDLVRQWGMVPNADCQVLSPMYRNCLGVDALNTRLQQALNPNPAASFCRNLEHNLTWGVGDKLMQTANDYDLGLMNGDIVILQDIVFDHKGKATSIVVDFLGVSIDIPSAKFNKLTLAYACTIHKSQGGQYPVVVIVLHNQHYILLQRNLLYTAITRAKDRCILVGSEQAIRTAVQNNRVSKRNSWLTESIGYEFK